MLLHSNSKGLLSLCKFYPCRIYGSCYIVYYYINLSIVHLYTYKYSLICLARCTNQSKDTLILFQIRIKFYQLTQFKHKCDSLSDMFDGSSKYGKRIEESLNCQIVFQPCALVKFDVNLKTKIVKMDLYIQLYI